jgi:Tol biopolymer transport system component
VYNTDGTGEVKITASDGAGSDEFGESVAIQGDKIAVGASGDDDSGESSGSVYVYNTDGTGEQKITASDGAGGDKFGRSVAIN